MTMKIPLMFEAVYDGNVFGGLVLDEGVATARVGGKVLSGVLFGHAVMWVREHSPHPWPDVELRLVSNPGVPETASSSTPVPLSAAFEADLC
jgi:hypothetical protein